jgi:hypothetical protein
MPIPREEYDYYRQFITWLRTNLASVPRTLPGGAGYACDITDIVLILVPQSVVLGKNNNAIYIGSYHKPLQVTVFQRSVDEHAADNPHGTTAVVQQKTFLAHTKNKTASEIANLSAAERMKDSATAWHEHCHGVLDRLKITNSEDNTYVAELDVLAFALSSGALATFGLNGELLGYLTGRVDQYRLAPSTRNLISARLDSIRDELIRQGADAGTTTTAFADIVSRLNFS